MTASIKKRTVLFIPSLRGGGAERVVVNIANGLRRRNEEVSLLLYEREGVYFDELDEQVPIDDLGISSRYTRLFALFKYISFLKKKSPEIILVSGHSAFLLCFFLHTFFKHKLMVIVHNTVSEEKGVSRYIAKFFYRYADSIIGVSKGVSDDITQYASIFEDKVRTIYNPVDLRRIESLSMQKTEHLWLQDQTLQVVVAVGALSIQKNYPLLLNAIAVIRKTNPAIRLLILGEGEIRSVIESKIQKLGLSEIVELLGFTKNPYAYMRGASRFVLSSDFEGFGLVLVEAMASGARIISTDCPSGPAEILEYGRWGKLVPVGNAEELAKAIMSPITEFPKIEEMRVRASDFSLDHALEAYLQEIYVREK